MNCYNLRITGCIQTLHDLIENSRIDFSNVFVILLSIIRILTNRSPKITLGKTRMLYQKAGNLHSMCYLNMILDFIGSYQVSKRNVVPVRYRLGKKRRREKTCETLNISDIVCILKIVCCGNTDVV